MSKKPGAIHCFLARLLLIHEYRKLLLRDPQLPDELLPADWEGKAARLLCRNIHKLVWERSQGWLEGSCQRLECGFIRGLRVIQLLPNPIYPLTDLNTGQSLSA